MFKQAAIVLFGLTVAIGARADDWPQWGGPRRDNVWREKGIVAKLPAKLQYRWRTPISAGYAGPAVAGNKVFVSDRRLPSGVENPDNAFARLPVEGTERVLALDVASGKILWEHEYACQYRISYPAGPRATPSVAGGKVYVQGAMGDFLCLNAADGKPLWRKQFIKDYNTRINTWGTSAAPLVDGDHVIVLAGGARDACVVCLERSTGKLVWRALFATDFGYCPPIIIDEGGVRQLIVWTPDALSSLDPATGKLYWQQPFKLRAGLSIPAPIHDSERHLLFVTAFYNGPMMMKVDPSRPEANLLWKGKSDSEQETDGLHAIMCTPTFQDGFIYGVCSYGQLRCLNALTGERRWETTKPTGKGRWWNAFIVRHEDRFFLANEQGELITAKFSPEGYDETSRAKLIAPTNTMARRKLVWSHPAFAQGCVFARNDEEIVCVDLRAAP